MIFKRMTWGAPVLILLATAVGAGAWAAAAGARPASDPMARLAVEFQRDVAVLASDDMEGRGLGTEVLVWASNRANPKGRETNLFIARWVD